MRLQRWRPYPVDETCKLYLPFYRYGGEQSKIWDLSTSHNDGTIVGAVPGTYPMISPPELMPNQVDRDFSGASAWTNVDLNAYNETTDLTITANAADQYCTCPVASVPTTIGKRYRLYYDLANIVQTWTVKGFDGTQTIGTISANATQYYLDFVASTTGGIRLVAVANTSSGDFDNFSLKEITGYSGLGWYFDGVDDKITVADSDSLDVSNITILIWFRSDKFQNPYTGLVTKADPYYLFFSDVYPQLRFYLGASALETTANGIITGKWAFVAATHKSGETNIYVDGSLNKTTAAIVADMATSAEDVVIGHDRGNEGRFFCGQIGEVFIFNRVLSAQDIRNHFELTRAIYGI